MTEQKNHLAGESSLYLQQHATNPVNWYPWSDEAWAKAKKENKLVLISIGYSSCHWCHVMEHETFTDADAAKLMNERFICIKVDREERPDIDQIYMTAVQLMTGSGGWPLNCFALPDGRPIYGGTYFPKSSWMQVLVQLDTFYKDHPDKCAEYAAELTSGLNQSELINIKTSGNKFDTQVLNKGVESWKTALDNVEGGTARAPKFPMPCNYEFLLRFAVTNDDKPLLEHVKLTLTKMAFGGIYDHVGGGFSRYSTDSLWKLPHFEKMLYDNAQLISLYANAYKATHDPLFKKIAEETIHFLQQEMSDGNGGYYSAFDADSEGEEGKFYVWSKKELEEIQFSQLKNANALDVLFDYYNVNEQGYWENGNYILLRKKSDLEIATKYKLDVDTLKHFIDESNKILYSVRKNRIHPGLDKKIITSWNALQISALCQAFQAFGEKRYKEMAVDCANGILTHAFRNGNLIHVRQQKHVEQGYLEDYAFTITAFINLYQVTLDEKWILQAKKFADDAVRNFYDSDGYFYFTSSAATPLIARKKEISDNVIPASNSEMAKALFLLGDYFADESYNAKAIRMLHSIEENIIRYPYSHSNWMSLYMNVTRPFAEIVVTGPNAIETLNKLYPLYLPSSLLAGSVENVSSLPLLENRFVPGKTNIYVCRNRTCLLPVEKPADAISLLKKEFTYLHENVDYSE